MIPYNPLVFAVCDIQPGSESKENKGDDAVISSVVKGHMDLRHIHLISRLTGEGSSVSQTFACWGPKSINTSILEGGD